MLGTPHPHPSARGGLHQAVANRAVLDQAKGALMLRFRVDPESALDLLRTWAAETRSTTLVVALTVVHGVCQRQPDGPWDRSVLAHVAEEMGESLPEPRQRRLPRPRGQVGR